jgi:hypothetical protein
VGEGALPFAVMLASVIVASGIVYAARTLASAIAGERRSLAAPLSAAGFPVDRTGIPVNPETRLEPGSAVLAFSHGRWWRAEVTALEGEDLARIHYAGRIRGLGPFFAQSFSRPESQRLASRLKSEKAILDAHEEAVDCGTDVDCLFGRHGAQRDAVGA